LKLVFSNPLIKTTFLSTFEFMMIEKIYLFMLIRDNLAGIDKKKNIIINISEKIILIISANNNYINFIIKEIF